MGARLLAIAIALLCALPIARADTEKPWAAGVPPAKQKSALAVYNAGNAFFEQSEYKEALEEYEKALALWDHPAIRYNAAVCLFHLDRPVEAYEYFESAMRFGEAPLGPELFQQGHDYLDQLEGKIGELRVSTNEPDVEISLDGKPLVTGPGKRRVTVGAHELVAIKPHYEPFKETIVIKPGVNVLPVVKLKPLPAQRRLVRRWAKWKPWAVLASGGTVTVVGVGLLFGKARPASRAYDEAVAANCTPDIQNGVPPCLDSSLPPPVADAESKAKFWYTATQSTLIAGGAIALAGAGLVLLNHPRLEPITPVVGRDHVGLAISGSW